jgi:hypothetical protein
MNLAPASAVEVHLIVEDCEDRLNEQQVDELIAIVARHLNVAGGAAADGDDAMQE